MDYAAGIILASKVDLEFGRNFYAALPLGERINLERVLLKAIRDTIFYLYRPTLKIEDEQWLLNHPQKKVLAQLIEEMHSNTYFFYSEPEYEAFEEITMPEKEKVIRLAAAKTTSSSFSDIDYNSIKDEQIFFEQLSKDEQNRTLRIIEEMEGNQAYSERERLRDADEGWYYEIDQQKKFWVNTFIAAKTLDLNTELLVYQEEEIKKENPKEEEKYTIPKVKSSIPPDPTPKKPEKVSNAEATIAKNNYFWLENENLLAAMNHSTKGLFYSMEMDEILEVQLENDPKVSELLGYLKEYPKMNVFLEVHTDNTLDKEGALAYTYEIASDVESYLADQGISKKRLIPVGWGSNRPRLPNTTEFGRQTNRRIEFYYYVQNDGKQQP